MDRVEFTKMVAAGNDFVVIASPARSVARSAPAYARAICDRKYGLGGDGLLLLEKSKVADVRMRIFNADGSEAEMCGNGARCAALYVFRQRGVLGRQISLKTKAGMIHARVHRGDVTINLTDPRGMRLDMPITVAKRPLRVNCVNTGVPHVVVFTEGLGAINVRDIGRQIRYHRAFRPAGTNVNFVEVINGAAIRVRTYERGVEDETLACGTGSTASALVFIAKMPNAGDGKHAVSVTTQSREVLTVGFEKIKNKFTNVWLQGKVRVVAQGVYYV